MKHLYNYLLVLVAVIALAGIISPHNPFTIDLAQLLQTPSLTHWLGTDELGRDILVRLGQGVWLSLVVGIVVACSTATIGIGVGLVSGYFGGWVDQTLMRITDTFLAFPGILLAIAFTALAGPSLTNVVIALSIMGWVGFARLARAQVLALKQADFVSAAHLSGVKNRHILLRYILPNAATPLIIEFTFAMAGAIVAEAGLSFLGLGVQAPTPSLGAMLKEGARFMLVAPHTVLAPGIVLMTIVLTINLIGDSLRNHLDKRDSKA